MTKIKAAKILRREVRIRGLEAPLVVTMGEFGIRAKVKGYHDTSECWTSWDKVIETMTVPDKAPAKCNQDPQKYFASLAERRVKIQNK